MERLISEAEKLSLRAVRELKLYDVISGVNGLYSEISDRNEIYIKIAVETTLETTK
jgi:hypothetical protein